MNDDSDAFFRKELERLIDRLDNTALRFTPQPGSA